MNPPFLQTTHQGSLDLTIDVRDKIKFTFHIQFNSEKGLNNFRYQMGQYTVIRYLS